MAIPVATDMDIPGQLFPILGRKVHFPSLSSTPPLKKQKVENPSLSLESGIMVVTVPREKLLKFTREDLDNFVAEVTQGRKLTKQERKEVSRQRKMIKNRRTAAASRQRQKEHLENTEAKHAHLVQEQQDIKARLATLETQNQQMKHEVGFLHNLINSHPLASAVMQRTKALQKQFSMADPGLLLAAKYVLLFTCCIYFFYIFAAAGAVPLPKAFQQQYELPFRKMDDFSLSEGPPLFRNEDSDGIDSSPGYHSNIPDEIFGSTQELVSQPKELEESLSIPLDYGISDDLLDEPLDSLFPGIENEFQEFSPESEESLTDDFPDWLQDESFLLSMESQTPTPSPMDQCFNFLLSASLTANPTTSAQPTCKP